MVSFCQVEVGVAITTADAKREVEADEATDIVIYRTAKATKEKIGGVQD